MGLLLRFSSSLRLQEAFESSRRTSEVFDIRRGSPMRIRTWWWLWRGRGAFPDGGLHLQRASGVCGRFDRGSRQGCCLHDALFFESREALRNSTGRTTLFTCYDRVSSSRVGGDQQGGYSEEDLTGSSNRTQQAVQQWNWPGFIRRMSVDGRRNREDDEGDWKYSPEWWGTQAGGWGHNEGEKIFQMPSVMGNGVVSVTAHPASTPSTRDLQPTQKHWQQESGRDSKSLLGGGASYKELGYEWRVLRFNNVTRQSVAKVKALETSMGDVILLQQPNCIAFEYIKTMISAGLAAVSLSGLDLESVRNGYQNMQILCIGLGGGSLPLFLAHILPGATVEVVEIDGAVISAAVETMGFPPSYASPVNKQGILSTSNLGAATKDQAILWGEILGRIIVHEADGDVFVQDQARKLLTKKTTLQYDLVFVDAYDGEDVVPLKLWDRTGPFLSSLSSVLNADHGTVVVNLHTDSAPSSIFERISGKFGPGFDPTLPQGNRVQEAALAYRDVLLQEVEIKQIPDNILYKTGANPKGLAFTVSVSLQANISLVVSRGASETCRLRMEQKANREEAVIQTFVGEAERIQNKLDISFNLTKRVQRGFQVVK